MNLSWEEFRSFPVITVRMKLIRSFLKVLKRLKTSVDKVTLEVVKIVKQLELELKSKDVTDLLKPHNKAYIEEELLFVEE